MLRFFFLAMAGLLLFSCFLLCVSSGSSGKGIVAARSKLVYLGTDGRLVYAPYNEQGDTIPDFSHCGYGGGGVPIPDVPVKVTLSPQAGSGDDLARIQAAVDEAGKLPVDSSSGFRGAVLLKKGEYRLSGTVKLSVSGVVLRGEGTAKRTARH